MRHTLLVGLAGILGLSCAGAPPPTLADISSDVRLDSLPAHARVALAGRDLGPTPLTIHIQEGQSYDVSLSQVGFQPRSFGGSAEALLRNRAVEVVLAPQGFDGAPPRSDDAAGLTAIAEVLERRKDWAHAAEFWRRVVTLAPRGPRGHRGLGSALAKLGQDELAIREYEQYLFLDPDAPDAERVQKAIDAFRGGIDLPGLDQ